MSGDPMVLDEPALYFERTASNLTLGEALHCELVKDKDLRALRNLKHPEAFKQRSDELLATARRDYATLVNKWPDAVPGPLLRGRRGLMLPQFGVDRASAELIREQLEETAKLRELARHERRALRVLRAQGVAKLTVMPRDAEALDRARLKRLSKAAKRARASQRAIAHTRAQLIDAPAEEVAAC